MLKMSKSFIVRMVVWTALVLYMLCDFFLLNGPLKQELRTMFPTPDDELREAVEQGICAKVYNAPIYLTQGERRVTENLWRNGRSPKAVSEAEMKMLKWVALNDLIDENILRIKVHANRSDVVISEDVIDAEVERFKKRFTSEEELDEAMKAQGIQNKKELRYRIAAKVQQEKYMAIKIESGIEVSDEEAKEWYDANKEAITMPERRRVRHIFIATLDRDSAEVQQIMQGHFARLTAGDVSFTKLAEEVSEDDRTKSLGGDLDWMTKERILPDFSKSVFAMSISQPQLIQTKIGWHIVEVTDVKSPQLLPYEKMKDDIITSLRDSKRREAIAQYRHQLRLINFEKVDIYKDVLEK